MKNSLKNTTKTAATVTLLLALSGMAQAGTLDEVRSLWDPQGISGALSASRQDGAPRAVTPVSQPRWFRLSNGRQVDLRDWKVVLFMQGKCPYCHKFDPVLKQLATQYGFSVFPYTFLVNVNTLAAYPVLQGATDAQGFMARVDTVFQMMGEAGNGRH